MATIQEAFDFQERRIKTLNNELDLVVDFVGELHSSFQSLAKESMFSGVKRQVLKTKYTNLINNINRNRRG